MRRLAMYTFGVLNAPFHSRQPSIQQFLELAGLIYGGIAGSPGYIAHAIRDDLSKSQFESDWGSWGEYATPSWYHGGRGVEDFAAAATFATATGYSMAAVPHPSRPLRHPLSSLSHCFS